MSETLIANIANLLFCGAMACFVIYWALWAHKDDISLTGALIKSAAVAFVVPVLLLDRLAHVVPQGQTAFLPLMALGLVCGALGDFALARRGERAFLAGMAAFATGHLVYAAALWRRGHDILQTESGPGTGIAAISGAVTPVQIAALGTLALLVLSTELWLRPRTGSLRWPVRGYVMVIGAMAAVTILLPGRSDASLLRLGVALFVLSDLLLALRLFVVVGPRWKLALSLLVWPSYWLAQMLIMLGAMFYASALWF